MNLTTGLLGLSGIFYAAAFLMHQLSFTESRDSNHRPAFSVMRAGFLVATFYFLAEAIDRGFFLPVLNFSQAMAFFAWSLAFVYLVLIFKAQTESFGLILSPILLTLTTAAFFTKIQQPEALGVPKIMMNPYFTVHIVSVFFAYANFTISFAAAILYLIQHRELKSRRAGTFYHRLPALEDLERLIYQPLLWGAPLLAAALVIGLVWSKSAFGHFSFLEPKTLATFIVSIFYFVILYLRFASSIRGKQGAVMSLLAFSLVVLGFVGMRFIHESHYF